MAPVSPGPAAGARVAVIGAGISGLTAAWTIRSAEPTAEITIYEASDRVGGKLHLAEVGGVAVDVGAESVLARRPEAIDLVTELGLADHLTHPARIGATIVSDGRRWPVPGPSLMGVPADPRVALGLLTADEVDRALHEVMDGPIEDDVSVGDLVDARLGRAVTDKLVEPLLAGVYAGRCRALSARAAVPALAEAAARGRSLLEAAAEATAPRPGAGDGPPPPVFATLAGGIGRLPMLLAERLEETGVRIRTRTVVRGVAREGSEYTVLSGPTTEPRHETYDAVVLATPAAPTARLLGDLAPDLSGRLAGIEYASMAVVTVVLDEPPATRLTGSGFLVPPTEPLTVKAATFSSLKWPWLATREPGRTWLRASIGRHGEAAVLHRTDEDLVALALADLGTVLGEPLPTPVATHLQRWGGGLPQYAVGHLDRVAGSAEPVPGLALCGAAYDGVGIPACIGSGRRAAATVLAHLA